MLAGWLSWCVDTVGMGSRGQGGSSPSLLPPSHRALPSLPAPEHDSLPLLQCPLSPPPPGAPALCLCPGAHAHPPSLPGPGHLLPLVRPQRTARDSQTGLSGTGTERAGVVRGELGLSGHLSTPGLLLPLGPWRGVTIVTKRGTVLPFTAPVPDPSFLAVQRGQATCSAPGK